ncbi:glycosyltransferase family 2 protein [bacterium]|nr:glycosyltransferase family 2 protein [bacterium]
MKIMFWIFITIVFYVYFGYPLLLIVISKFIKKPVKSEKIEPLVSIIITAYNEEKNIQEKLDNTLAIDYPKDKLEIIIASDGSTDRTNEIVREFEDKRVKLVYELTHKGKSSIQNKAVEKAKGEILVFSDATSMYKEDALKKLISNFNDEKVGCVTGKACYVNTEQSSTAEGESIYWRYELFLRKKESDIGILAMASGCFFAVRKNCFILIDSNTSDDFILPMNVVKKGFRVIYDTNAIAYDKVVVPASGLLKTKARTIGMDVKGLFLNRNLLNPFSHFAVAWSLISHKLLRWLIPFFLMGFFICNLFLLDYHFYQIFFVLQILFYLLAGLGYLFQKSGKKIKLLGIPFSFCVVNTAALIGTLKFLLGKASGKWEPIR